MEELGVESSEDDCRCTYFLENSDGTVLASKEFDCSNAEERNEALEKIRKKALKEELKKLSDYLDFGIVIAEAAVEEASGADTLVAIAEYREDPSRWNLAMLLLTLVPLVSIFRKGRILSKADELGEGVGGLGRALDELPGKLGKTGPIKEVPNAKALDDLYDALSCGAKTVDPGRYPGIVKKLPDGTIIRRRLESVSGGATLDITMPDGTVIKVHIKR